MFFALRSILQAKVAEGNLHVALLRDAKSTFWTRTVWTTEAAMKAFMLSGPHREMMPRLLDWCDAAAHGRRQQEGRRSKVRYPSPAHEKFDIRRPQLRS